MVHSVVSIEVNAPTAEVFDVVHDYRIRTSWDTLLRSARMQADAAPAAGEVAICAAHWYLGGLVFRTRYVTFTRPTVAAVTLVKPYFVFGNWTASIRHHEIGDGNSSEVVYTLTLRCRPRWLGRALDPIVMKAFEIETRRRLRALKRYLESGGPSPRVHRRSRSAIRTPRVRGDL